MIQVKSLLTAEIGHTGYREFPIENVEAFTIDAAMDSDADAFSIDIGAPSPSLTFLLDRDNEVRASIFTGGVLPGQVEHLHTGIADVLDYSSEDFVLSISGRDLTSLAVDSQAPPGEERHVRPSVYVARDAQQLGITKLKLAEVEKLTKFYRDGSESYWESWYRMYRKRKMWVWAEPDGTLIADTLHYSNSPAYYFGTPKDGQGNARAYIPVESVTITKSNQQRVGEVWVFGERGDIGFVGKASDPSISSWKKKPLKIITSTDITSQNEAVQEAWEEIFEGKVGALEIVVDIALSSIGEFVKQNNMALVNVPDMGLSGVFFVVGVRMMGGPDGYRMQVRLREKNFAISRRIPSDPTLVKDTSLNDTPGDIGDILSGAGIRWASSFAAAAQEFHDGWDYGLFLGVLLAICSHESSFRNVRGGGDTEWYPMPSNEKPQAADALVHQWQATFANSRNNPLNPRYPNSETAVGPMQLVTPAYKVWADNYGGKSDEYSGGRWVPGANIRAGARAFAEKLSGLDPQKAANIWIGVERYYGSSSASANRAYRDAVYAIWKRDYQSLTADIAKATTGVPVGQTTNVTVPDDHGNPFQVQVPTYTSDSIKELVNFLLRQRGKPYQWGATGPNSYDCSGLAVAAYKHINIDLPGRTTYQLFPSKLLDKVTKDDLLPGDMVFFADGTDVHHMGLYLNDNHMIQAPDTGDVVKISAMSEPYYRNRYVGARRVPGMWRGR